jgi:hypothetical protein
VSTAHFCGSAHIGFTASGSLAWTRRTLLWSNDPRRTDVTYLSLSLLFQDPFFGHAGSSIGVYFPPEIRSHSLRATISDDPADMEDSQRGASTHSVCLFRSWHGSCDKGGKPRISMIVQESVGPERRRVNEPRIRRYPMPVTLRWTRSFVSNVDVCGKPSKVAQN